jgi:hypothetical protein
MDWDNVRGEKPSRPMPLPMLDLLETCWRLTATSGRILTCGIYRTDAPGLEVRAGYGDDDLRRSQLATEIESAREIAEKWRRAAIDKGWSELMQS